MHTVGANDRTCTASPCPRRVEFFSNVQRRTPRMLVTSVGKTASAWRRPGDTSAPHRHGAAFDVGSSPWLPMAGMWRGGGISLSPLHALASQHPASARHDALTRVGLSCVQTHTTISAYYLAKVENRITPVHAFRLTVWHLHELQRRLALA